MYQEIVLSSDGKYKDGDYFNLTNSERNLVDKRAEEICIATRLLSLSSNKKFSGSKQELRNDLLKGKDNYLRAIDGVLKSLNFHNLHANTQFTSPGGKRHPEIAST